MTKTTLKFLLSLVLGFVYSNSIGQENIESKNSQAHSHQSPNGYVRCATVEYEAALKAQFPQRSTTEEFESWLAPKIEQFKADRAAGRNIQAVYNIPVVIHIIHDGDAVGTGENITNAQARSQIKVMNEDYRRMAATRGGANTTGLAVDVEINFVLATIDPSGNPSTGIVRHNIATPSGSGSWDTRIEVEDMKTNTSWNTAQYLNMWTCRFGGLPINQGGNQGLLGYAQFPAGSGLAGITGGTVASTDGVVSTYDAFGTNDANDGTFILNPTYNLGRTMTHEVGHWLGLRHIWGDNGNCTVNGTDSQKDYCPDTPAANTANYGCAIGTNTCTAAAGNDMVQNYMDYTDDGCMDTFTANQKTRMQTVMSVGTRRASLNTSPALALPATPYVLLDYPADFTTERTNCSYTDVDVSLSINKAPTTAATVNFNVTGGTATLNSDYQILNPTVVFAAGSLSYKKITIRVFHDSFQEGDETITANLTVGGGNAQLYAANNITFTIKGDGDAAIATTENLVLFSENFDPQVNALTTTDIDGDTYNWGVYNANATVTGMGFTGKFAGSRSWMAAPVGALSPDNLITTNAIVLPAGTSPNLSFAIASIDATYFEEHYAVYVTTSNVPATIIAQTPVHEETIAAGLTRYVVNVNLSAYAGQTVYVSFRHFDTTDMNILILDDIRLTNSVPLSAQTAVNTPTAQQFLIPGAGLVHAYDTANGKIMSSITSDAFNYGCTTVSVSRDQTTAGAAAVAYNGNNVPANYVLAKTVTIAPTTNNATGNPTVKFYFTNAEITAWEAATGKSRTALKIIKDGAGVVSATTVGTYLANVTLEGAVSTGLNGVYYFGSDTSLASDSFELLSNVSIYPNPTSGTLNIRIPEDFGSKINYTIYNSIGQLIGSAKTNSQDDLRVNTTNYSNGLYFIKIEKDGEAKTFRFIKN